MSGAAILTVRAALRSGAGLVTAAVPEGLHAALTTAAPEALTLALPESPGGQLRPEGMQRLRMALKERRYTVLAIGPGLSTHPETQKLVVHVLSSLPIPAVIDADALNLLAGQDQASVRQLMRERKQASVVTPHPGEMARCLGIEKDEVLEDRQGAVEKLALEWKCTALLKGHRTLISDGKRTVCNATGGPGLAKGGSGDLLTGLIAGLWAQMLASGRVSEDEPFRAAALGAYLHGLAGDLAEKAKSPWAMTALDVLEQFPEAFKRL